MEVKSRGSQEGSIGGPGYKKDIESQKVSAMLSSGDLLAARNDH